MTSRWNFNPGPAMLPAVVIERIRADLGDWQGSGMSVMEVSHRSPPFIALAETIEARLRRLLQIPNDYHVLFLQGGASTQFALVPLNFCPAEGVADYAVWGHWGAKAQREANCLRRTHTCVLAEGQVTAVPSFQQWRFSDQPAYVHYAENETIAGIELRQIPPAPAALICDMSSSILSRPCRVAAFGMIYACAQKNFGPAGITVAIIAPSMLETVTDLPTMLSYPKMVAGASMANTPPTFALYVLGLVLEWLEDAGGVSAMARQNKHKASVLYDLIDASSLYLNPIEAPYRSRMNATFFLAQEQLTSRFLAAAFDCGLIGLKGHRVQGGLRASLYNAMPLQGVEVLAEFMREFERTQS